MVAVIVAGAVGYGVVLHGGSGSASPTAQTLDGIVDNMDLVPPDPPDVVAAPADEQTTPITGQLSVGASTALASQTIGTSGGTIQATGLTIEFPASALAADTSFAVSSAPITGQTFGGFITPVTPLYHVDDGDAELDAPVAVTLAAQIPDGATAMAFYYDQASGELTPLMPDSQDASGMTVGATHFSDLFGALIDLQKIPTTVDSGFRAKKDDWQFPNEGSYIEPDGQCAGKVDSEIWYYADKHLRGSDTDHLYGQFDNNGALTKTPTFWQDDSEAYRFTAEVQVQPWANVFVGDAYRTAKYNPDDRFTYAALRSAIALSGEPQFLSIATADDSDKHAIAVYRVEPDKLWVADPNFAGVDRTISYDPATGKLGPFLSGISTDAIAAAGFSSYTRFAYVPWRSNVSESAMAGLWAKLQAGIAGDETFPKYQLYARSVNAPSDQMASWSPLSDGFTTSEPQLVIAVAATGRLPGKSGGPAVEVQSGAPSSPLGVLTYDPKITLGDGDNSLGILELGPRPGTGANGQAITVWTYVDFVRLNVIYGPEVQVSVSPTTITDPSAFHTLLIDLSNIPSSVTSFRTVVDWGDGRAPQVLANRSPDADGTAHVVMTSIYPPPNGGKDVTQITVSFQDANGNPLSSCPESTSGQPSGGCRKWPTVRIPVVQPSGAPSFASASIEIWMGHCSFCLDFRPGRPIRLVAGEPGVYTGSPDDLAAMGLASLDLQVGDNGRTITSLRVVYADDADNWFVLTNIPITATITDPADQKAMSQFSLGSWDGIMPHLQWQANITVANGSHEVVTQGDWIEDSSSVGQEFLNIYLKRP